MVLFEGALVCAALGLPFGDGWNLCGWGSLLVGTAGAGVG